MKALRKADVILFGALLVLSGLLLWLLHWYHAGTEVKYLVVTVEEEEVARIPLTEEGTYGIRIEDTGVVVEKYSAEESYQNVFVLEDGTVRMSEAACPDLLCVKKGIVQELGIPIVCLPHGVVLLLQ